MVSTALWAAVRSPSTSQGDSSSIEISTWDQLAALPADKAVQGHPVRIRGVVVCYDLEWGQLYIHDGRSIQYFSPTLFPERPGPGTQVEITGVTRVVEHWADIDQPVMRRIGSQELPPAPRLRFSELTQRIGQWVEISGQIRRADDSKGRLCLTLRDAGLSCLVYIMGPSAGTDPREYLGREICLRGINASKVQAGALTEIIIFAPGTSELRMVGPLLDLHTLPTLSIDALLGRELGEWTNHPVRLSGLVTTYQPGEYVVIQEPTGTLRAEVAQVSRARIGERISVWGYLSVRPEEAVLTDAFFEPSAAPIVRPLSTAPSAVSPLPVQTPPLTQISNIFTIPRDQLAKRFPVRLKGVMTYSDPEYANGFLQQGDFAIYLQLRQEGIRAGQWVEVEGVTDPGGFAPQINDVTVEILGSAPLPIPLRVSLNDLAGGDLDSHFVELEGVVRRAEAEWNHLRMTLGSRQGRFDAIVPGVSNTMVAQRFVGARLAVSGACASMMNARGQISGVTLHVPNLDGLRTLSPAQEDPFNHPITPIGAVATFDAPRVGGGRIKVSGTITLQDPPSSIYIQDASGGMRLATYTTNALKMGDTIEAVGFPALGDFSPCLEEVLLQSVAPGPPVVPLQSTAHEILASGRSDGCLVNLKARLIQRVSHSAQPRLVLQDGPIVFAAYLVGPTADEHLRDLEVGSLLRLTGVSVVQGGHSRDPESFRLLVGSVADVHLLDRPSWWSVRRALTIAGGLALAALLALFWVGSLRRRVHAQTDVIRRQLEEGKTFADSLDRERNLLATLIDHLPDHVFVMDGAGRLLVTNRSYDRFVGGPIDTDTTWREHAHSITNSPKPESPMAAEDRSVLEEGARIIDSERSLPSADGTPRWLSVSKVPLKDRTGSIVGLLGIRHDVTDRKRTETELLEIHRQLLAASHRAGMAEVATSVLHNVGNVLTSINVSVKCLIDQLLGSKVRQVSRLADMLPGSNTELAHFLLHDPRGCRIPEYLRQLSEHLGAEREGTLRELHLLRRNVDHIKHIVARQQDHARAMGVTESIPVRDLVDDAVSMCSTGPQGPRISIERHYPAADIPNLVLDRHKALEILVNLVRNAIQACEEAQPTNPKIDIKVEANEDHVLISIVDNGSGIAPEHRPMLFRYGFTTRQGGHGFGLHNAALAAKALGGELRAFSDGPSRGATFTLVVPFGSDGSYSAETPQLHDAPGEPGPSVAAAGEGARAGQQGIDAG
ncbi:MAG: PAS domain-containing protein [Verrucomicrobiales bacterium]|nr:PAS domain-containing protein [Verrucomicrobiales bacterium]